MLRMRSRSFQRVTVSLYISKGYKDTDTVCKTLRMIQSSGTRTWAVRLWFDSGSGIIIFKPTTLKAGNFSDLSPTDPQVPI